METVLRIRESSPSELFAERLEREAALALSGQPERAADYRRQAQLLRDMAITQKIMTGEVFVDNFLACH